MLTPNTRGFRRLALALSVLFAATNLPIASAVGEMIPTDGVVGSEAGAAMSPAEARDEVSSFLAREDVRQELKAQGVAPDEAQARVAVLSDAEAVDLAQRIDEAPAGQAVGAIIGAGLIIFLVLVITDVLGFTSVFGFTHKGSANPT